MDQKNPNFPQSDEQKNKATKAALWAQLGEIGLSFAGYIAIPLLIFIYLGKWADKRYDKHFFVIIGIFVALFLSSYLIYKKIKDIKEIMK